MDEIIYEPPKIEYGRVQDAAGPWINVKESLPQYPERKRQRYLVLNADNSLSIRTWAELTILDRTAKDVAFKPVLWAEVRL